MKMQVRTGRGITILELMIVLLIVSMVMGISVMTITRVSDADLRADAMRLASVMRYSRNAAAMNNARYRMVFDFQSREFYTEVTDEPLLSPHRDRDDSEFLSEEARALAEEQSAQSDLWDHDEDPFRVNRKITYQRVQDAVIAPRTLKDGISFRRIYTTHRERPFEEGRAVVSFFPNGFQEQVMVVIENDNGAAFTIETEPLTGRVLVHPYEKQPEDEFGEVEEDRRW